MRPHGRSLGGWWAGLCWAAAAQGAPLYQCPGNLFTNELDPVRAQAQGCRAASADGLSQAVLSAPAVRAVAVAPAQAEPAVIQPVKSRLREPASRVAFSKARSEARYERTAAASPSPAQKVSSSLQKARDSDAQAILQAELARTVAAQQALAGPAGGAPDSAALQRLRVDEVSLRRELERLKP